MLVNKLNKTYQIKLFRETKFFLIQVHVEENKSEKAT